MAERDSVVVCLAMKAETVSVYLVVRVGVSECDDDARWMVNTWHTVKTYLEIVARTRKQEIDFWESGNGVSLDRLDSICLGNNVRVEPFRSRLVWLVL